MCNSVSRVVALSLTLGALVLVSQPGLAQQGNWYVGAGAGLSRLSPDADGSDFTLEDEASAAAGLYVGMDLTQRLGVEAAWTQLGEAGLSGGQTIDYSALSIGGIAYVLGSADLKRRQDGWSGYLRLGFNKISNESEILLAEKDNTAIWAGAGIQWPMSPSWGIRGELASFDGDAQAAMASVYWRPGAGQRERQRNRVAAPRPAPISGPIPAPRPSQPEAQAPATPELPAQPPVTTDTVPAPTVRPLPKTVVTVEQSLSASASSCAVPAQGEPLDAQGCALFSGVLQGVEFDGESTRLTSVGETLLARLAGSLNLYPELLVEIRVHTQTFPEPGRARELSRQRAIAVARYLVGEGVDVKRLKARAFGDTQPRAGNDTAGGQRLNNRVELRVL